MTSRSSSVSLPHCSFTLPLTCFQLPSTRFQSIFVSPFFEITINEDPSILVPDEDQSVSFLETVDLELRSRLRIALNSFYQTRSQTMSEKDLSDLFVDTLKDIYYAEKQ